MHQSTATGQSRLSLGRASGRGRAALGLAVISALVLASAGSFQSILGAPNPYAPNVTDSVTTPATVVNNQGNYEAVVFNGGTTGVTVLATGLNGISDVSITTQSLNSPSAGVSPISSSGRTYTLTRT